MMRFAWSFRARALRRFRARNWRSRGGVKRENIMLVDTRGVVYKGRKEGMNKYKDRLAVDDKGHRTLADAMQGADVFYGLSVANVLSPEMVKTMAADPIIFAMANPDPEIRPELAREARKDVIIATGRSDYVNQVNNVLGFPFIFRGALDVRARQINEEMKFAASKALAALAKKMSPIQSSARMAARVSSLGVSTSSPSRSIRVCCCGRLLPLLRWV
jgi:malate dehydrogenase (oxaloacetate-decarboxylating)(NADP+)